jgi:REP element-mobilizing transposase RayT
VPPPNSKPSTQFAAGADSESTSDSKTGRRKPGKDSPPKNVHFETFENRAYAMSYACLLIPRDPEHLLSGKVADFIKKSIQNVCIAFGWQLAQVQVQPEYFQWVVNAKVGTPPSKCIHMIREETSKGILAAFRQFRTADGHTDFWAPGYLVLVGSEPHPPGIIQEFIKLTRQQQDLSRRARDGAGREP